MIRAAALLIAAAAIAPLPAAAQAVSAPAIDPVRQGLGYELATLLNPEEATLATVGKAFDTALPTALLADPEFKRLEEKYPGVVKALTDAVKPVLLRHLRADMPKLWTSLAPVFAEGLTADELRQLVAFYRSPIGIRIVALMSTEADFGTMLTQVVENDFVPTDATRRANTSRTVRQAMDRLTPQEIAEVERFAQTPAARKLMATLPRMHRTIEDWSDKTMSEMGADVSAAMIPVVERFTGTKIQ